MGVFLVTKAVMVQLVYQVWQVQLDQRVNKVPMVHLAHLDHLVNCPYFHLSCSSREMLHMNLMHPEDSREHQNMIVELEKSVRTRMRKKKRRIMKKRKMR